jgi:uncharacterized membrane protein YqjE
MAERDPDAIPAPGVVASLRSLAANVAGLALTRLQLLANELEEERVRTLQIIAFGAIAFFCGLIAALLATVWIIVALWEQYRLATLAVLVLCYAAGGVLALRSMKARSAGRPKLFSASLAEFRRDRDSLGA